MAVVLSHGMGLLGVSGGWPGGLAGEGAGTRLWRHVAMGQEVWVEPGEEEGDEGMKHPAFGPSRPHHPLGITGSVILFCTHLNVL